MNYKGNDTMYYSLLIEYTQRLNGKDKVREVTWLDHINLDRIKSEVVEPYLQDEPFIVDGYRLRRSMISRIKIVSAEYKMETLVYFMQSEVGQNVIFLPTEVTVINDPKYVKDITTEVLQTVDIAQTINTKTNEMSSNSENRQTGNKVFIVHGRDNAAKLEVARFLEKLGLEAIILHEQPNQGKTLIEKIEAFTDVAYGIVLYTPCDKGGLVTDENINLKFRARQNVVFEHGYLIAKLGRNKVCALMKPDVEYPNDMSGILYLEYLDNGDWQLKLAKEMRNAGLPVNLNLLA